jgi:hypothetical protein
MAPATPALSLKNVDPSPDSAMASVSVIAIELLNVSCTACVTSLSLIERLR